MIEYNIKFNEEKQYSFIQKTNHTYYVRIFISNKINHLRCQPNY